MWPMIKVHMNNSNHIVLLEGDVKSESNFYLSIDILESKWKLLIKVLSKYKM